MFLKMLTFGCFNYLHGGNYRNNRRDSIRNTLLGSERTDYLLCVGYNTLRIQETENKNSVKQKTLNIKILL